jgi:transcriptional regulator GlxA family with amidase domain
MRRRRFLTCTALAGLGVSLRELNAAETPATVLPADKARLARPKTGLIRVACAVSRNTTLIDYVGPMAVFEAWFPPAGASRPEKQFEIYTVAESTAPVSGVVPDYTFGTAPAPHVVVVPAQVGSEALRAWLRAVHKTADVVLSVCTGARHLALAGLLNGRVATTHAKSIDRFAKEFPDVRWVRDVRFVEGEGLATSGGLTAGIDLALRVVERYFSREQAQYVATHLEYDGRRWMV